MEVSRQRQQARRSKGRANRRQLIPFFFQLPRWRTARTSQDLHQLGESIVREL